MSMKTIFDDKNQEINTGGNLYDNISRSPILDVSRGGQGGFRHKIANVDPATGDRVIELHNDTKHLDTQIIPILMQAPKGFNSFDNPESWRRALKHIVEVRPESITGLKGALTVNFLDTPVSGGGEMYSQATNVLRERTQVEFTWKDIVGRSIQKLLVTWIQYLIFDPDTKVPKITFLNKYLTDSWTTDYQTMTMLFIATDITHRYVDKAWLVTSMMPNGSGPIEGRRNYQEDATPLELVIGFTGVAESTQEVVDLAEMILSTLDYLKTDTDFTPLAFDDRYVDIGETGEMDSGFSKPFEEYTTARHQHYTTETRNSADVGAFPYVDGANATNN